MKPDLAWSRTAAVAVTSVVAALALSGTSRAQNSAPAPYPPPGSYAPAPGAYAPGYYPPPPGAYPPGYYAPPPTPYPPAAQPEPAPSVVEPAKATHFGVGYKIGNGLGLLGGDIILSPLPQVVLDLQANTFSVNTDYGTATGFGIAPALQLELRPPGISTPYIGAGYVYAKLGLNDVTASASGVFINAGYEWKWSFGMGIILGGGLCYLGKIEATDGSTTISQGAQWFPTLEFGLRFMFL